MPPICELVEMKVDHVQLSLASRSPSGGAHGSGSGSNIAEVPYPVGCHAVANGVHHQFRNMVDKRTFDS